MSEAKPLEALLIWERPERGTRGPKGLLTRSHLALATVQIADTEGLAAVTMRRVATELGVGVMSLYRYVLSKDDLLDLAFDAVYRGFEIPETPSENWREELRSLAHATRGLLRRHPWSATLLATRPPLGPNYLRWFEYTLSAVEPLTNDIQQAVLVVGTVNAFVLGSMTYELTEAEADMRTGLTDEQKRVAGGSYLEGLFATGRFPHLQQFVASGVSGEYDQGFEFGLECLLEGIATRFSSASLPASEGRNLAPGAENPDAP